MTAWEFLRELHSACHFMSRERAGRATNSEIKRWLVNGAVLANGERLDWNEKMDFPLHSLVLFPRGRQVTLW